MTRRKRKYSNVFAVASSRVRLGCTNIVVATCSSHEMHRQQRFSVQQASRRKAVTDRLVHQSLTKKN